MTEKKQKKQVVFFLGTTAEFIKVFPILLECRLQKIEFQIVLSGQNDITSTNLYNSNHFQHPYYQLSNRKIKKTSLGVFSWFILTLLSSVFQTKKIFPSNSLVVVHGDTLSTLLGSILARLSGKTVIHIEAGLRSKDWLNPFPEEITRNIVSHLANVHICPNKWAASNLKRKKNVFNTTENTLLDSTRFALAHKDSTSIPKNNYFILVYHRQENLLNKTVTVDLINSIINFAHEKMQCIFVVHPATKQTLKKYNLWKKLIHHPQLSILPPQDYVDMIHLINKAQFMVTDGGSNQEEVSYLGKPCLILRSKTERIEGIDHNVVLSNRDYKKIKEFFNHWKKYKRSPNISKTFPSKKVVEILKKLL